jgi:ABC-type Mn2+/Zn2+ transport system ATPase subunit
MTVQKKIVIIAGPNGAGKTTFARVFPPKLLWYKEPSSRRG